VLEFGEVTEAAFARVAKVLLKDVSGYDTVKFNHHIAASA